MAAVELANKALDMLGDRKIMVPVGLVVLAAYGGFVLGVDRTSTMVDLRVVVDKIEVAMRERSEIKETIKFVAKDVVGLSGELREIRGILLGWDSVVRKRFRDSE